MIVKNLDLDKDFDLYIYNETVRWTIRRIPLNIRATSAKIKN